MFSVVFTSFDSFISECSIWSRKFWSIFRSSLQSWDLRFFRGDLRVFDFFGKTHRESHSCNPRGERVGLLRSWETQRKCGLLLEFTACHFKGYIAILLTSIFNLITPPQQMQSKYIKTLLWHFHGLTLSIVTEPFHEVTQFTTPCRPLWNFFSAIIFFIFNNHISLDWNQSIRHFLQLTPQIKDISSCFAKTPNQFFFFRSDARWMFFFHV